MDLGGDDTASGHQMRRNPDQTDTNVAQTLRKIEEHLAAMREAQDLRSRDWLSIREAAQELAVSPDTIERLVRSGDLAASKVTTSSGSAQRFIYRIRRDWLEEYLLRHRDPLSDPQKRRQHNLPSNDKDFIG